MVGYGCAGACAALVCRARLRHALSRSTHPAYTFRRLLLAFCESGLALQEAAAHGRAVLVIDRKPHLALPAQRMHTTGKS